jgi:hypothetical protein
MKSFRLQSLTYINSKYEFFRKRERVKRAVFPVGAMKTYRRSWCIAPLILNFGTRWRWMVNFNTRLIYLRGGGWGPCASWIGGWVGPRNGLDVSEKIIRTRNSPARCLATTYSALFRWHKWSWAKNCFFLA